VTSLPDPRTEPTCDVPELQDGESLGAARVKFEKAGDAISGVLTGIDIKNGLSGDVLVIALRDRAGAETEVWCQSMLARLVAELDPDVGTGLTATMTGLKNTGRPQPMKEFDLEEWTPGDDSEPY